MVPSRSGHSRSIEGQNERPSEREIDSGEQDFHTFRGTAANQIEEIRLSAWTSLSGSLSRWLRDKSVSESRAFLFPCEQPHEHNEGGQGWNQRNQKANQQHSCAGLVRAGQDRKVEERIQEFRSNGRSLWYLVLVRLENKNTSVSVVGPAGPAPIQVSLFSALSSLTFLLHALLSLEPQNLAPNLALS